MDELRRLHEPFVYAALLIALTAGFGYGAYLVAARVYGVPPGTGYSAIVQAHGHAQLFGWVGLFLLGVGLFFLPKLRGTKLEHAERAPLALGLLAAGIGLRSIVQPLAGYVGANAVLRALLLLSAVLELAGALVALGMLVQTQRTAKPLTPDAPAYEVQSFAQLAFLALGLAFVANFFGVWNAVAQSKNLLAPRYDQLVIMLWLYGAAIPLTFVFAVRTLPLYLRLVVLPRGVWQTLSGTYLIALVFRLLPNLLAVADDAVILTGRVLRANYIYVLLTDALAVLGILLLNVCILIGIWQLGLWRRRGPRSDHGEFGRFDLLIYSAYAWLVVAVMMDVVRALPIVNEMILIPQDAARHALMAGFITLLIFGMGARMLSGFSGKRKLALPQLVFWTFVLGNAAAFLRVVPPFLENGNLETGLVAVSGLVGWGAVLLFAIMFWKTFRQTGSYE